MKNRFYLLLCILSIILVALSGCTTTVTPIPKATLVGRIAYTLTGDPVLVKGLTTSTSRPVAGARVVDQGTGYSATTDSDGYFTISNLPVSDRILVISHTDFRDALTVKVSDLHEGTNNIGEDINLPVGYYLGVGIGDYTYLPPYTTPGDVAKDLVGPPVDLANVSSVMFTAFQGQKQTLAESQATKANILAAIANTGKLMDANDFFVFYFSGHGISYPETNSYYPLDAIAPVDYNPATASTAANSFITDKQLADVITNNFPNPSKVVVIIDACNSGSFFDGVISSKSLVSTRALSYIGCTVLAASTPAQESYDIGGSSPGGLFTKGLIKSLTDGKIATDINPKNWELSTSEVFKYAHDYVMNYVSTHGLDAQEPTMQLGGNPILLRY